MRHIKNYIFETTTDTELLSHILIDYHSKADYYIYERYGMFDSCENLSRYIWSKVLGALKNNKTHIKFNICDDPLFDSVEIEIHNDNLGDANIDYSKSIFKDKSIELIYMNVSNNSEEEMISHELTHLYNYKKQVLDKGITSFEDLFKSKEYSMYSQYRNGKNVGDRFIRQCLYLLNGYEKNAFISQMKMEVLKNKKQVESPSDVLDIIKKTNIYKMYNYIYEVVQLFYQHKLDESILKQITDSYNEINNTNKDNDQIFKELSSKSRKVFNKLTKLMPKICMEYLEHPHIYERASKNFIKEIEI